MNRRSRLGAIPLVASSFLASGCATLTIGTKMEAKAADSRLLDLCVFSDDQRIVTRNTIESIMGAATANLGHKRAYFRTATYIRGLDDGQGCDVVMKIEGRSRWTTLRPVEIYSAYSKELLHRFDGNIGGDADAILVAAAKLDRRGPLYRRVMEEAGPARMDPRSDSAGPGANDGLSKEELRRMIAESVKAPAKELAPVPAVSDADVPRYKKAENPDDYAVIVGVEKYTGLPDAQFAERDAKAVYDHLLALGYPARNIALLTGTQATRTGLVKNLEAWLPQNVGEKSTVFFYYSGHGAPDPAAGTAYLVPSDGDPQYLQETAYPVKRVYEKLNALKAKRVLVAMDACFSGSGGRSVLAKGTRPLVGKIDLGAVGGKVVALTASAASQISGSLEEQGHGLFTYYLLRGLNGDAKDASGRVTVRSLYSYLAPKVQDAAKRSNRDQMPQLLNDAADLVLR